MKSRTLSLLLALWPLALHAQRDSELGIATTIDPADRIRFLDVSDTSAASTGTNKTIAFGNIRLSAGLPSGAVANGQLLIGNGTSTFSAATLTAGTGVTITNGAGTITISATADLSALNASNLTIGTIPDARFPATLPALSGVNLTTLNAGNLGSGTVPNERFPATLPVASGANLTALNASNLASGTVPDARFPATLPLASGANLTALNASNLSSGTIPDARFPATLPAVSGANLTNLPGGNGPYTAMGAGTVLTVGQNHTRAFAAPATLTFSGTPANGSTIRLIADVTADVTVTIPASHRTGATSTTTSVFLHVGTHELLWKYDGTRWVMTDSGQDIVPPNLIMASPEGLTAGLVGAVPMGLGHIPDGLLTDVKINWGTGPGQVSGLDIPQLPETFIVVASDLTTTITAGTGRAYFNVPWNCTVVGVRATVLTASSSGLVTVDINEAGVSILSTPITIDVSETSSRTADVLPVISDTALLAGNRVTIDIDAAGTGATGVQVHIDVTR